MRKIRNVAYELELFASLTSVYPMFHVPMLKKFMSDNFLLVPIKNIRVKDLLSYEKVPIEILDRQV